MFNTKPSKPLADFYYGESFVTEDEDGYHMYMVVDIGREDWQSPKTNVVFAVDMDTARIESFVDDVEYEPLDLIWGRQGSDYEI